MSSFQKHRSKSIVSTGDLSAKIYHAVKLDSSAQVVIAGAGEGMGIVMNAPAAGEFAEVALLGGGALVELGATVAIGAELAANAAGEIITATSGDIVLGLAMAAGVDGDIVEIERVYYVKA